MTAKARVVGLMGAVAGGKSSVAALLARRGARVVDADRIGHAVLEMPDVKARLAEAFGDGILTPGGAVDRARVADIVFADAQERERLEAAVHPEICRIARAQVERESSDGEAAMVVLDAALLLEKGLDDCCDVLVFVDTSEETRRERAAARGWSAEELAARDAAQIPAERKRERADFVIRNDGTPDDLAQAVNNLVTQIEKR